MEKKGWQDTAACGGRCSYIESPQIQAEHSWEWLTLCVVAKYVTLELHEAFEAILSGRAAADQKATALILKEAAVIVEHLCLHVHHPLFQWQYALARHPGIAGCTRGLWTHKSALH